MEEMDPNLDHTQLAAKYPAPDHMKSWVEPKEERELEDFLQAGNQEQARSDKKKKRELVEASYGAFCEIQVDLWRKTDKVGGVVNWILARIENVTNGLKWLWEKIKDGWEMAIETLVWPDVTTASNGKNYRSKGIVTQAAMLSDLIYFDSSEYDEGAWWGDAFSPGLKSMNLRQVMTAHDTKHDLDMMVAVDIDNDVSKPVFIAFAGTASLQDVAQDANARPVKFPIEGFGSIQNGFLQQYEDERQKMFDVCVRKLWKEGHRWFVVTGHSLGGAVGVLAAADLKYHLGDSVVIDLITFGAPPVGDKFFLAAYETILSGRNVRFTYEQDLVACIVSPFFQSANEVHYQKGKWHDNRERTCSWSFLLFIKAGKDHSLTNYIAALKDLPEDGVCRRESEFNPEEYAKFDQDAVWDKKPDSARVDVPIPKADDGKDKCGDCGGNNFRCTGCDGVINSGKTMKKIYEACRWSACGEECPSGRSSSESRECGGFLGMFKKTQHNCCTTRNGCA